MTNRVLCPKHSESTPSCVIYDDGYHCYGCGAHGPLSDLGITVAGYRRPKEDLSAALQTISKLPRVTVRGLQLPVDANHYYILWPDGDYYKKRSKVATQAKYLCPSGHSKPLFKADVAGRKTLAIVEGEINALSLAAIYPPFDVVSPGGACEFTSRKYMTFYQQYGTLVIVADEDTAGLKAAIELKAKVLTWTPHCMIYLMKEDCNDVLTKEGVQALRGHVEAMCQLRVR